MQELLQQIDLDYYRSARLLIAHAELEQLRQVRSASADVERRRRGSVDVDSTSNRATRNESALAEP
jgi:hypothetical protein